MGTKRRFGLIIQAGQAFSRSLMAMLEGQRNGDPSQLESHSCESETTMIDMIRRLGEELDGIAIICKNVTPLVVELQRIRNAGKPVLAVPILNVVRVLHISALITVQLGRWPPIC
jgi:hypothetical protein